MKNGTGSELNITLKPEKTVAVRRLSPFSRATIIFSLVSLQTVYTSGANLGLQLEAVEVPFPVLTMEVRK